MSDRMRKALKDGGKIDITIEYNYMKGILYCVREDAFRLTGIERGEITKEAFLNPPYPTFGKLQNSVATVADTGLEAAVRKPFGKHRLVAADRKPALAQEVFQFLNRVKLRKRPVRVEETYQAIFQKNTTRLFLSAFAGAEVKGVYFIT